MVDNNGSNRVSYLLIIVLMVAIASASYLGLQRHGLEADNNHLDVVLDFHDVEKLTRYTQLEFEDVYSQFKDAGISGILFKELTINDLEPHSAWVLSGAQVIFNESYREALGEQTEEIHSEYNYLVTKDETLHKQIKGNLEAKLLSVHVPQTETGIQFVGVPINKNELETIGLGFNEKQIELAAVHDLNVIVQVRNWPQSSAESIKDTFALLTPYQENISTVMFNDAVVPGFPNYLNFLNMQIKELDANFGFVETFIFPQRGSVNLGLIQTNNVVRVHSISANEMLNMSPQRALDRLILSVTDRNVRIVLARLFFPMDTVDWMELNLRFVGGDNDFKGLVPALEGRGFTVDKAAAFPLHVTSDDGQRLLVFFIGLGVISAGIILLRKIEMAMAGYILGILGILGWSFTALSGVFIDTAVKLMALASVIIFPVLGLVFMFNKRPAKSVSAAVVKLLITSAISLIGALLMVGLLGHLKFMLKLDQFAGVKVAHVVPIVILMFLYYFWFEKSSLSLRISNLWNKVVVNKHLVLVGIMLVAGFIYVTRTGNEAIAISSIELQLRTFLDNILAARPRTKEFLIGHPLMLFLFYRGYRHRYLPILALGAIGQISMVNTFAHVHTPLVVSMIRTFNGLWLGIIFGIILIALWEVYKHFEGRLLNG